MSRVEIDAKKAASIFKALSDENRIQILSLLSGGEKCACKLLETLQITQPTLSHHMKILCDAGIVVGRKDGKWMHYSISDTGIKQAYTYFGMLTGISIEKSIQTNPSNCC